VNEDIPPSLKHILECLMIEAAPERTDQTRELLNKYDFDVECVQEAKRIRMEVINSRAKPCIRFDAKTIDIFWLICFAGWRAIECYSPVVIYACIFQLPIESVLAADDILPNLEYEYKSRLTSAQTLIDAADAATAPWPTDMPRPSANRDALDDVQYKASYDLTCMTVAFILFHELMHVIYLHEKNCPADHREEELNCDVWAREYMTAKLAAYAQSNGHDYQEVLRKRSMAFALAALVIHEITPFWEHGGNAQYFSVSDRIQAILDNTPLPDGDYFWLLVASLLLGIYRKAARTINAPQLTPKELARHLINGL
jgi:hypothetical protein